MKIERITENDRHLQQRQDENPAYYREQEAFSRPTAPRSLSDGTQMPFLHRRETKNHCDWYHYIRHQIRHQLTSLGRKDV